MDQGKTRLIAEPAFGSLICPSVERAGKELGSHYSGRTHLDLFFNIMPALSLTFQLKWDIHAFAPIHTNTHKVVYKYYCVGFMISGSDET